MLEVVVKCKCGAEIPTGIYDYEMCEASSKTISGKTECPKCGLRFKYTSKDLVKKGYEWLMRVVKQEEKPEE